MAMGEKAPLSWSGWVDKGGEGALIARTPQLEEVRWLVHISTYGNLSKEHTLKEPQNLRRD